MPEVQLSADRISYDGQIVFSKTADKISINYKTNVISSPPPHKDIEGFVLLNQALAERLLEKDNLFQFPAASINVSPKEVVLISLHAGTNETYLSRKIANMLDLTLTGDKSTLVEGKQLSSITGTHSTDFISTSNAFYSNIGGKQTASTYEQSRKKIRAIVYGWVQPLSGYFTEIEAKTTRKKLIHCAFLSLLMRGTGRTLSLSYPFPSLDDNTTEVNRGKFIARLAEIPLYEIRGSEMEIINWFGKQFL